MPEALKKFLESLSAEDAVAIWKYLDENPFAADEMIELIVVEAELVEEK